MTAVEELRAMAEVEAAQGHVYTAGNFRAAADLGAENAIRYLKMVRVVGAAARRIRHDATHDTAKNS